MFNDRLTVYLCFVNLPQVLGSVLLTVNNPLEMNNFKQKSLI